MLKLIFLIFPLFNLNFTSPSPYHPHLLPTCCSPSPHLLLTCSPPAPHFLTCSSPAAHPLLTCSSPVLNKLLSYSSPAPHLLLSHFSSALRPIHTILNMLLTLSSAPPHLLWIHHPDECREAEPPVHAAHRGDVLGTRGHGRARPVWHFLGQDKLNITIGWIFLLHLYQLVHQNIQMCITEHGVYT